MAICTHPERFLQYSFFAGVQCEVQRREAGGFLAQSENSIKLTCGTSGFPFYEYWVV